MATQAVVNKSELWVIGQATMNGLGPHYQTAMGNEIQQTLQGAFFPIFLAQGFAPKPFSAAKWNALFPYSNIKNQRDNLKNFVERGFLKSVGDDAYEVTETAHTAVHKVFEVAHEAIGSIKVFEDEDMEQLADYLKRIVEATLASPEPDVKYAIEGSRWTDPGQNASALARVDQYLTDLSRYRDDAHIAAFAPHGVPAHAWEAFTLIWREAHNTPDAIAEQQVFRNHDAESYRKGLDELVSLGWLTKSGDQYVITDAGKSIREAAEEETDRLFYIGWSVLSESELAEMGELLAEMQSNLARLTAEKTSGLLGEVGTSFFQAITDDRAAVIEALGFSGNWFNLFNAYSANPDSFTAADLQKGAPYTSLSRHQKNIDDFVEKGGFEKLDDGTYKVTEKGHQAVKKILKATWESFAKADLLNSDQLKQLLGLMQKISGEILAGNVPNNAYTAGYDNLAPPDDEIPLVLIDHQSDLIRLYRDDAHHAVWQDLGVEAHAFEAFTFIWRGEQDTAAGLAERLPSRGYSADDYAAGLKDLVKRGWIKESGGKYSITAEGQRVRDEAEVQTDENYYQPWMVLDISELTQLHNLMLQLRDASKAYAEKVMVAARHDLYNKLQNCVQQFYPLYRDQVTPVIESTGFSQAQGSLFVTQRLTGRTNPTKPMDLAGRNPYANVVNYPAMFERTAEAGFIDVKGDGYIVSEKGYQTLNQVNELFYGQLAEIGGKVETDLARVYELLNKALSACLNSTDDPPGNFWLRDMDINNPGEVSITGKIDHCFDCFNAFRDDAHLATWKNHGVEGHTWETLTKIYNGDEIKGGADLQENLGFRGHSETVYSEALETLVEKGWIELKDGKYAMSESGQTMRDEAERLTDLYFYRPWFVLNTNEVKELRGLLEAWEGQLKALVEAKEAEKATA